MLAGVRFVWLEFVENGAESVQLNINLPKPAGRCDFPFGDDLPMSFADRPA
jgi:hypothetical protein